MVIIISDINRDSRKKELLAQKEKIKIIEKANCIKAVKNIEIINPILKYEKKVKDMYNINYPIYKEFEIVNMELLNFLNLNNEEKIIIPYFDSTSYWISLIVINKFQFFSYMYENGFFNNITIINISKEEIFDVEIGERKYEMRKNTL